MYTHFQEAIAAKINPRTFNNSLGRTMLLATCQWAGLLDGTGIATKETDNSLLINGSKNCPQLDPLYHLV